MAGIIKYVFWFCWTIVELALWPVRSLADAADIIESDSGGDDAVKIFEIFSCFAGIVVLLALAILKFWLSPGLEWKSIIVIQLVLGFFNKAFFEAKMEYKIPYLVDGNSESSSLIGDGSFEDFVAWPFLTLSLLKREARLVKLDSYFSVALLTALSQFSKVILLFISASFFLSLKIVFIGCFIFYNLAFSVVYFRVNDDEDMLFNKG